MATRFSGIPGYVPSGPIADHIETLAGFGLPLSSIARDAGCTHECVEGVLRRLWRTTRVRQATAIMAVSHRPNERQEIVLAIGAVRRLRALHAIGWTWHALSAHTPGLSASLLSQIARPGANRIIMSWSAWATIRDAFEKLSGTPGTQGRAKHARLAAERRDWPAPLDWEGLDIDDPRVTAARSGPPKVTQRTRAADRRELARELLELGLSVETTAARLGVTVRQVERYIREFKSGNAA
ncbi:helix-turn-helix domain-containing protein [Nocardia wallacei]|uniref:helix-turn-helix domain-containing protein n=1 Tax=Nocardia wallacei TaxID=480035 RepID=UPI0024542443|nr:helix-turn-helix domain-containing protein [Nocardia wallacei]